MPKIYIENKEYTVESRHKNLLEVCLTLGFNLPYFCWHPVLGSVGACRQCAVKKFQNEQDTRGRIVMACMEPVVDGMRISITDPEAKEFRAAVIEWLMTNHPHDCPVCDEGGECHLQDMTVMTQHNYRRYRFNKRTHKNQYLGPFINHEMNRCIACYRCVRYYRDYAGGKDLNVFSSRNRVYFGRQQDGVLESEFSGNLIEICPTGVFTDKTFKQHYSRKWDLQTAPSICVHCSLGCNIIAGERYGILRRVLNRYNSEVNGYFICDRGRFGYEFVNSKARIKNMALKGTGKLDKLDSVSKAEILNTLRQLFTSAKKIVGIGSPRASLESNFALRTLVGVDNFYQGVSNKEYNLIRTGLTILSQGSYSMPSLRDCEQVDAVFILGEDITNTAPMLDLAVRQALRQQPLENVRKLNIPAWHDAAAREVIQDQHGPLFVVTTDKTKLDEIAAGTYRAIPAHIARLGFAVANLIDEQAPPSNDISAEEKVFAEEIARSLQAAKNPLIITGCSAGEETLLQAAANIASALSSAEKKAGLFLIFNECNSVGLGLLGGKPLAEAAAAQADILIIAENDLYRRWEKEKVDEMLTGSKQVIVLDHLQTEMAKKATILLPVSTFAEASGSLVNNEGRAQRFFRVYPPAGDTSDIQESWRWFGEIMQETGRNGAAHWDNLDSLLNELVMALPAFEVIKKLAPDANFRIGGEKIPRQSHRYSGRTSMNANIKVSEPKPPADPDTPFAFSMEGYHGSPPSSVIPLFWSPGWNSVQSVNKFQQEVGGALRDGDPGLSLIRPLADKRAFYKPVVLESKLLDGEWWIVAMHHIFGSEELSAESPGIAELAPNPYALMNRQDGQKLQVKENDKILLQVDSLHVELTVRFSDHMAAGSIGYPLGLRKLPYLDLPARGKVAGVRQ
jgi:NADH-quinone oxidoreductase subunit G